MTTRDDFFCRRLFLQYFYLSAPPLFSPSFIAAIIALVSITGIPSMTASFLEIARSEGEILAVVAGPRGEKLNGKRYESNFL